MDVATTAAWIGSGTNSSNLVEPYDHSEAEAESLTAAEDANDLIGSEPPVESWENRPDDIRTEYHPTSCRDPKLARFEDYGRESHEEQERDSERPEQLRNAVPWYPYRTRLDFDLSELMMEAALNQSHMSRLISIIQRAQASSDQDEFTIKSYSDLAAIRQRAANQYVDVSHKTYTNH